MKSEASAEGLRRLLRRLPLLVVLLALAWVFLGDRPRELTLVYDIPDDPAPTRVDVRIEAEDGTVPAKITWGTGQGAADDRQAQTAVLAPGVYRLEASLRFPDGATRRVTRDLEIGREDERIVIHLQPF